MNEGEQQPEIRQDIGSGISFMFNSAALPPRLSAEEAGSGQRADSTVTDTPGSNQALSKSCNKQLVSALCQLDFHFKVKAMNWALSELTSV